MRAGGDASVPERIRQALEVGFLLEKLTLLVRKVCSCVLRRLHAHVIKAAPCCVVHTDLEYKKIRIARWLWGPRCAVCQVTLGLDGEDVAGIQIVYCTKLSCVAERLYALRQVTLGLDEEDVAGTEGRSFAQLGGDSLAAIQFARSVGELCGVNLPVSFVLDHSHSLGAIAAHVQELVRCAHVPAQDAGGIHGFSYSPLQSTLYEVRTACTIL